MRIGMTTSCTVLQIHFSHGLDPTSVISQGVMWACLPVSANPWETQAEVLVRGGGVGLVQELTCCSLSDMLGIQCLMVCFWPASAALFKRFGICPAVRIMLMFFVFFRTKLASAIDSSEEFIHTCWQQSGHWWGQQEANSVHCSKCTLFSFACASTRQQQWVVKVSTIQPVWKWKTSKHFFPISLSNSSLAKSCRRKKTGHSDCVKQINLSPQGMPRLWWRELVLLCWLEQANLSTKSCRPFCWCSQPFSPSCTHPPPP